MPARTLLAVRIDLHAHSLASDGTETPRELVVAAREASLDVLAITDHDTAAGWDEAVAASYDVGVTLVRGMEISTKHGQEGVHLLAYLPDPTAPGLAEMLDLIGGGRESRVPAMLAALGREGVAITMDDVRRANPGTTVVGRPHVADALVGLGAVASRDEAFARFLDPGRPAFVDRYAAPTRDVVAAVARAGGVSVVAHVWGRSGSDAVTAADLADLRAAGLGGLEVDHQEHSAEQRVELRAIARDLDLVVTGSSDHHGRGRVDRSLGCQTTDPVEYERLLARAAAASAASGRDTPEVVAP